MAGHSDYYSILRVSRGASEREIRQSYRSLVFQLHPDHNPHPDAAEGFRLVQEAWETLGDPMQRALYDQLLDQPAQPVAPAHRDPAYRRRSPAGPRQPSPPSPEKLLMFRLVPYATQVLRIGLFLSAFIALDLFLPERIIKEVIVRDHRTRQYHDFTTDKGHVFQAPYPSNRPFIQEREIIVAVSPVLQVLKHIDTRTGSFRLNNLPSVYANFLFIPITLLVISAGGLAFTAKGEARFNFGVVAILVLFFNIIFFALSVW